MIVKTIESSIFDFHSHYHFSLRMMIFTHHINRKEILDNERRKRIT
jgi:hypothetical protein